MQISPVVGAVAGEFEAAHWLLGEGNTGPGHVSVRPGQARSGEEASRNPFESKSSTAPHDYWETRCMLAHKEKGKTD